MSAGIDLDVLVVGAGIAGLWTTQRLRAAGHVCALVERSVIGAGQSRAAQGIIHGGTKYALGPILGGRPGAIAAMPGRWRACLEGRGELDLSRVSTLADACWLWADTAPSDRLTAFLSARLLRRCAGPVARSAWPDFLAASDFDGLVLRLDEPVVDVPELLAALAAPLAPRLRRVPDLAARIAREGERIRLTLDDGVLSARHLVLCAGAGNAALQAALAVDGPAQRLRPLHQVCVRTDWPHAVHGHCLTGMRRNEPPVTITSDGSGGVLWLGGSLATEGVTRDRDQQLAAARAALAAALPGVPFETSAMSTLRIDRAEPRLAGPRRPDEAFVARSGNVITAWPMKLALAPDLADRVIAELPAPGADAARRDEALLECLAAGAPPPLAPGYVEAAE